MQSFPVWIFSPHIWVWANRTTRESLLIVKLWISWLRMSVIRNNNNKMCLVRAELWTQLISCWFISRCVNGYHGATCGYAANVTEPTSTTTTTTSPSTSKTGTTSSTQKPVAEPSSGKSSGNICCLSVVSCSAFQGFILFILISENKCLSSLFMFPSICDICNVLFTFCIEMCSVLLLLELYSVLFSLI